MTQTAELVDEPAVGPVTTEPAATHPNRLFQVAAGVAIVAGTLFIVATVFFAGFFIGRHSGHHWHGEWHHRGGGGHSEFRMMAPGMGPGQMGPGQMGPGQMGPGRQAGPMPGAAESPASSVQQRPSP